MTTDNTTQDTPTIDIEALPIEITYAGQTERHNGEVKWDCDHWRVRISYQGGYWTTDYYTGLGLRAPINPLYLTSNPPRKGTLAYEALEKTRKPVVPKKADVLYSLFMDAQAADDNFDEWCDTYGYSNDSIKALITYKECLDTATRLRKAFTKEQREAIYMIVQDM